MWHDICGGGCHGRGWKVMRWERIGGMSCDVTRDWLDSDIKEEGAEIHSSKEK
jgi:hypothetical protein